MRDRVEELEELLVDPLIHEALSFLELQSKMGQFYNIGRAKACDALREKIKESLENES